jgi:hypothetical protein
MIHKFVKEVRNQPLVIRHVFMWTMVVITFSVVGFAWFRSTQRDFLALVNESSQRTGESSSALATVEQKDDTSPFGVIGGALNDRSEKDSTLPPIPPRRLPVN